MNNKIAIGITAVALLGVFIINQGSNDQSNQQPPLTDGAEPTVSQLPKVSSANEVYAKDSATSPSQQDALNRQKTDSDKVETVQASNRPVPPPPPVGIPPMAPPANGQGVVSHPNHQAPIQAPISQSSPRRE
ncbi:MULTISPECIES: hypothetical protein [unclassified Shewanella]|uniref:hypothetical protein n=1 Tax=unclassified Shewanella TaxID=196818 RepID=UPI001BB8A7CC|nr:MULTISPECIES: hypothetical protein [unclassified Shewanella]GIU05179.1 hypothetical protein TUM4444_01110 [Shewanella sp. MBTL60-112-B1]GIU24305.1 hypothetical protein TUM4445_01260 [Shewanella sp. MBTL60-112-B2]